MILCEECGKASSLICRTRLFLLVTVRNYRVRSGFDWQTCSRERLPEPHKPEFDRTKRDSTRRGLGLREARASANQRLRCTHRRNQAQTCNMSQSSKRIFGSTESNTAVADISQSRSHGRDVDSTAMQRNAWISFIQIMRLMERSTVKKMHLLSKRCAQMRIALTMWPLKFAMLFKQALENTFRSSQCPMPRTWLRPIPVELLQKYI